MTREEYVERVLTQLHHTDGEERKAIREEIDAHIEDHICALLDLGYEEELAEERTMALMGDPEEVGREMDKQYVSHLWGWLECVAFVVLIVVIFQSITGLGILFHARDHILARFAPERLHYAHDVGAIHRKEDIRIPVGNDVLRIYSVSAGERETYSHTTNRREQVLTACVAMCAYDRILFGVVSDEIYKGLYLFNERGERLDDHWDNGGAGTGSYGAEYMERYVPIEPEDTYVTLTYDRFGETVSVDIPLPEVTP